MDTLDYLMTIGTNEKMFNSLYHAASSRFNLPEGRLWILYFLILFEGDISQQDVSERMVLPKQTINSATMNLVENGYVELEKIGGSQRKKLLLTENGKELAEKTVRHILNAEQRAVERMGKEKIEQYISLYREFYEYMKQEFQSEGIIDA